MDFTFLEITGQEGKWFISRLLQIRQMHLCQVVHAPVEGRMRISPEFLRVWAFQTLPWVRRNSVEDD